MTDLLERDAGFCSGGDEEDDMDGIHSPTDASEDSIDVKVQAISLKNKNKRKCAEPRRVDTDLPAKKRKIDYVISDSNNSSVKARFNSDSSPFRPWSRSPTPQPPISKHSPSLTILPVLAEYYHHNNNRETSRMMPLLTPSKPSLPLSSPAHLQQDEPLSLVAKKCSASVEDVQRTSWHTPVLDVRHANLKKRTEADNEACELKLTNMEDRNFRIESLLSASAVKQECKVDSQSRRASQQSTHGGGGGGGGSSSLSQQRNYKNMTKERRIEANARERTRVHTISAAFDTLRRSVPAYSHNQKLSKLSVLRIACSYIMTLSRMAGYDYSKDQSEPELEECVDNVSRTIQTEGKLRKKKED